jgi:prevent-host-death family protein
MTTISVQELKAALGEVLDRVANGESITVLRHGRPVARLAPPYPPGVHVGDLFESGEGIAPAGWRLSKGAYLEVLADDRGRDDE